MSQDFLFWFDDNTKRKLADKIADAAARYKAKFGIWPTICYTNPADLVEPVNVAGIQVEARRNVLRYHLMVGMG